MMGISIRDPNAPAETIPVFWLADKGALLFWISGIRDAYRPLAVMAQLKSQPPRTISPAELLRMPYEISLEETLIFGEPYPTCDEIIVPFTLEDLDEVCARFDRQPCPCAHDWRGNQVGIPSQASHRRAATKLRR